jgi:thiol-disulfide isomerase/thioredoxin
VATRRFVLVVLTALLAGLGAAAAAVALVGGDDGRASGASAASTEPVSGPPVRVSGVDVTTGQSIGIGDFVAKPVVLTVWASWCAACSRQAPPLRQFRARHSEAGFLAVDTQDDAGTARAFLAEHDLDLPTITDEDGRVAAELGVRELPTTIFLTSDHRVAGMWEGPAPVGRLRAGLQAAKAG